VRPDIKIALDYGWKIFPCHSIVDGRCTCAAGAKCTSPGKHPRTRYGVKDASSDLQVIERWWQTWPASNIGLACGSASNVVVIDIDKGKGGFESMEALEETRGPLPATLRAKSGGGGRHLFFAYPSHSVPNRVNWLDGVDVRSDGGYVILPEGTHISGGRYLWEEPRAPMATLPTDIAQDIKTTKADGLGDGKPLSDAASILDGIPEGERDVTLFRWACRLRRQHETDDDGGRRIVTHLVLAAAEASGFPKDQALKKVEQAFKQDHSDEVTAYYPMTDLGNRDRLVELYGDDLRYTGGMGWFQWGDTGWRAVPTELVHRMAEDVSQMIFDDAAGMADKKAARAMVQHGMRTQQAGALAAIEKLARQHPQIYKSIEEFDTNPTELACLNGIVDLRTGELRPFSRDDLVTKNTGVIYNPDAVSPRWTKFLETATQGDKDLQEYLQLAAGYTATGLTVEECFFVITGPKASGKSTYVDGLHGALGQYATSSQSDTFMHRRGRDVPKEEIARLAGLRMTSISEIREGDSFNEGLVKQVTGGDRITARFLYKDTFEFTPQFKLWFATNHDPMSGDEAMLRRIKRIIFPHTIPAEERDRSLKQEVKTSMREAILAWVVEGAKKYLATGRLQEPAVVLSAVTQYKADQDTFGMFAADCIRREDGHRAYFIELFTTWKMWCEGLGQYPGRMLPFKEKLKAVGLVPAIDDYGREYFDGIKVTTTSDAFRG